MSREAFTLTFPASWRRADLRNDSSVECERLARAAFDGLPDRDSRDVASARRRYREALMTAVTRARAVDALDLYFFAGASRTGIGPMSLMSLVVRAGPQECDPARALLRLGLPPSSLGTLDDAEIAWSRCVQRVSRSVHEWNGVLHDAFGLDATSVEAGRTSASVSQGTVHYATDIRDAPGVFLILSGSTLGTSLLGAQIAHLDSIVRTFSWTD
ncbi:hypothetical protein ABID81_002326 [Frigoribacterium sp. PvP054]|uniref:hypothetical protein n=1 Tax=Frigoribacterium sp. PvP054 TaxID=3156438 RepID=UPI0033983B1D